MSDDEQPVPTHEELVAAWQESLARKRGLGQIANAPDLQAQGNSAIHGKPSLSYAEMKQEFDRRRGISRNSDGSPSWQTPDNSEHSRDMPKPSEGPLRDQNGNFCSYESARARFFELQGRKDPLLAKKQHDEKTARRNSEY